jgi:hypothetical protein
VSARRNGKSRTNKDRRGEGGGGGARRSERGRCEKEQREGEGANQFIDVREDPIGSTLDIVVLM